MIVFYWCILFVIVHKDFWSIITKEKFCIWLWGKFWVQYYRTINSFLTSLVVFAHFVHCKEVQHYCKSITLLRLSHSQRLSDLKSEVPLTISTLKLIVFLEWHSWALTVLCCDAPGLHSNWRKKKEKEKKIVLFPRAQWHIVVSTFSTWEDEAEELGGQGHSLLQSEFLSILNCRTGDSEESKNKWLERWLQAHLLFLERI